MRNDVVRIRKFLFVWMLNASVYLRNCCWHEFQGLCGSNHLRAYNHVDDSHHQFVDEFHHHQAWISRFLWKQPSLSLLSCWYLLRDDVIKIRKFLFIWMLIASVYLVNRNFKLFAEVTIRSMKLQSSRCLLRIDVFRIGISLFLYLNVNYLCLFDKLLLTWNLKLLWKQPYMRLNEIDTYWLHIDAY